PGIGRYTAGAIASIAFNEAAPVLDGNVMRVFTRFGDLDGDITRAATQRQLWALARDWLHPTRPGEWNQALMELGRRICRPRQPDCPRCPLQHNCLAHARGRQHELPRRRPRPERPHYDDVVALLRNEQGELLIQRRPQEGLLGGLWTFPGGRARADDASLEAALRRCLRETLALEVLPGAALEPVQHGFTHFQLTLRAWECAPVRGPEATGSPEIAWVKPADLTRYSFGGAERALIANWLTAASRRSATPR
ncbi:MAG: NUDIX domain-containing protein, partial [Anaerolineaceae bacterium]|nr:NUDIX domain-containing protein [Anaerolineaceae bacterium]